MQTSDNSPVNPLSALAIINQSAQTTTVDTQSTSTLSTSTLSTGTFTDQERDNRNCLNKCGDCLCTPCDFCQAVNDNHRANTQSTGTTTDQTSDDPGCCATLFCGWCLMCAGLCEKTEKEKVTSQSRIQQRVAPREME